MKDIQSTGKVKALFLLMRPSQWVKNIILFLPMFFAQEIGDPDRLWNVAILFAGFCLLTSGVYVFNDLMDAGEDRLHPVKRFRPIASRKVSPMAALVFMFLLYGTSALCFSFMHTKQQPDLVVVRRIYPPELSLYALPQTNTDHRCHDRRLWLHYPA